MNLMMRLFSGYPIFIIEILTGIWEIIRVVIAFGIILYIYGIFKAIKVAKKTYVRNKRKNNLYSNDTALPGNEEEQPAADKSTWEVHTNSK